jgi:hypothetical protein
VTIHRHPSSEEARPSQNYKDTLDSSKQVSYEHQNDDTTNQDRRQVCVGIVAENVGGVEDLGVAKDTAVAPVLFFTQWGKGKAVQVALFCSVRRIIHKRATFLPAMSPIASWIRLGASI